MSSVSYFRAKRKRLQERSCKGVLARERKRMAEATAATVVGVVKFSGTMFGGDHEILCLNRDGEKHIMLDIDGRPHRPTTYRGVLRLLARRLVRNGKQKRNKYQKA